MSGHRARFFFKESEVECFEKEKMNTLKSKFPPQHRPPSPPAKKLFKYHSNAAVDDLLLYFLKTVNLHTLLLYNIRFCYR